MENKQDSDQKRQEYRQLLQKCSLMVKYGPIRIGFSVLVCIGLLALWIVKGRMEFGIMSIMMLGFSLLQFEQFQFAKKLFSTLEFLAETQSTVPLSPKDD